MQDQKDDGLRETPDEPVLGPADADEPGSTESDPDNPGLPEGTGKERRLHLRAYKYWYSLLEGRGFPAISDMAREKVETFRANSFLVDFPTKSDTAILRFAGSSIVGEYKGSAELVGLSAEDVPGESILSRLIVHFTEVLAHRAPVSFEAEYDTNRDSHILYRGILLPFSDDDQTIHFILGVLSWKEQALAAVPEKIQDRPPASEVLAEAKNKSPALPAAPVSPPDIASEALDVPTGDQGALEAAVAAGRQAASAIHHVDGRSRGTLYGVLAHALKIYEEGLPNPPALKQLLLSSGIRSQARAPFTPIIKLLFGSGYDKTRITEYATALSYAHDLGVLSGDLSAYLRDQDGGIKGCVMLARAARRGSATAPSGTSGDPAEILRNASALGSLTLAGDGSGGPEFTILVGRRVSGENTVEIVAELEQKQSRIQPLLKQAAKALELSDGHDENPVKSDGESSEA